MGLQHCMGERIHIDALFDASNQHAVDQGHVIIVVGRAAAHDRGVARLGPSLDLAAKEVGVLGANSKPDCWFAGLSMDPGSQRAPFDETYHDGLPTIMTP